MEETERNKHLQASIKDLFTDSRIGITVKLALMWFSLAFIYYALMFELPTLLHKINQEQESEELQQTKD